MKYYTQWDDEQNRKEKRAAVRTMIFTAVPCFAVAAAAFAARIEPLCTAAVILMGCLLVFFVDIRLLPAVRYGRLLDEIRSGSSHRTLGTLMRVSEDLTHENGVDFREVIINVYEDLSEEGERRFLLDSKKEMDTGLLGQDVVLTSYGNVILESEAYKPAGQEAQS